MFEIVDFGEFGTVWDPFWNSWDLCAIIFPLLLGCIHTGLVWFDWIELKFIYPLGVDLLGRCEYSSRTKQPYRDPAEEMVSVRFQTHSGMVEWINQWLDLKHTCGFFSFWFTCRKSSVKANRTKPKKSTLYLVRTEASEHADFSDVNTPSVASLPVRNTSDFKEFSFGIFLFYAYICVTKNLPIST